MDEDSLNQFDFTPILRVAELLAHAEVDLIAWNGTLGGWLGFDADQQLCEKVTQETGIPATTSMLAQEENQVKSVLLVTPYIPELNDKICNQYKENGIERCAQTINRTLVRYLRKGLSK